MTERLVKTSCRWSIVVMMLVVVVGDNMVAIVSVIVAGGRQTRDSEFAG